MIPRTKFGDCSNENCEAKNVDCIKVGKNLFCLNCRSKQKMQSQLNKTNKSALSRKLYKLQNEVSDPAIAERNYLIQDLDQIVSKFIRQLEADKLGNASCYTCGTIDHWKNLDCGHYVPRTVMNLRWDLRNMRPQCKKCNQLYYGNIIEFAKRLDMESQGLSTTLLEDSRLTKKWSREELKEMIINMRARLKIVESRFK